MDSFSDPPEPKTCCFGGLPSKSADFSVPHWNLVFLLMGASDDSKQVTVSRKTCPKHIRGCTVPIKLGHFIIISQIFFTISTLDRVLFDPLFDSGQAVLPLKIHITHGEELLSLYWYRACPESNNGSKRTLCNVLMMKNICEIIKKSFLAPGNQYNESNFSPWVIWIFKGHRACPESNNGSKRTQSNVLMLKNICEIIKKSFLAPGSQIQPVKARKLEFKSALIWSARYSREYASDKFSLIQWLIYYHLKPPSAKKPNSNVGQKNQLT